MCLIGWVPTFLVLSLRTGGDDGTRTRNTQIDNLVL